MIKVSIEVELISNDIASKSPENADYFPIDRLFLEPYVAKISGLNSTEFIYYNLEMVNPTYTNALFLCLPELWQNIDYREISYIVENFSNVFSYFTFIEFTYKYLEIDLLELILSHSKSNGLYPQIKEYLNNQWNILIKSEYERLDLEEGIEKQFYDYNAGIWNYIKQKLLLDNRIKPALLDHYGLRDYIKFLIRD